MTLHHLKEDINSIRFVANEIWKEVNQKKRLFEDPLRNIYGSSLPIFIKDATELRENILNAEEYAVSLCEKLSPELIPTLIQMYQSFYNGSWNREPAWLGTVIKRIIANVYKNQFGNTEQLSRSRLDLIQAIYAMSLYETLSYLELVNPLTNVKVNLTREWAYPYSDETEFYLKEIAYMYSDRGGSHRTLKQSIDMWAKKPKDLLKSINNILDGELPSDQLLFRNNFFRLLPPKKNFWLKFQSLVQLAVAVSYQLNSENLPEDSVVYLQGYRELNKFMGLNITSDIYWKKKWYYETMKSISTLEVPNIIVYRPILSFSNDSNLYVTSLSVVADAINYFIESSIFKNYSGHATPYSDFYQAIVATPFENNVLKSFKEQGFITGSVPKPKMEDTNTCIWEVQDNGGIKEVEVRHSDKEIFPGEIDVLAYHPIEKLFVIAESKTFYIPHSEKEIGNLVKKFTSYSNNSYQKKLDKKINWLKNSKFITDDVAIPRNPLEETDIKFKALFIVDRKIINMNKIAKIPIVDVKSLKKNVNF